MLAPRASQRDSPSRRPRLGAPASAGTRGARTARVATRLALTAPTAWSAGFSRHPRCSHRARRNATRPHGAHGLERRLQPAPAVLAPRASQRDSPLRRPRLGAPASAGTRGARTARVATRLALTAPTAWSAGFSRHPRCSHRARRNATRPYGAHGLERRLQPAPAVLAPRASQRDSPSRRPRLGAPASAGTRGARTARVATRLALTAPTAWSAGFSRHPRCSHRARRNATRPYGAHGLERRLQPAPAVLAPRASQRDSPSRRPRLGAPASAGTRCAERSGWHDAGAPDGVRAARPSPRTAARRPRAFGSLCRLKPALQADGTISTDSVSPTPHFHRNRGDAGRRPALRAARVATLPGFTNDSRQRPSAVPTP